MTVIPIRARRRDPPPDFETIWRECASEFLRACFAGAPKREIKSCAETMWLAQVQFAKNAKNYEEPK